MRRRFGLFALVALLSGAFAAVAVAGSSPSVSTGKLKSVKQTSAVVLGAVDPNGSATSFYFEWGLTSSYGAVGRVHSAGNGTKPVNVTGYPGGLIPGTIYHYNVVAMNRYGLSTGRDMTFKTAGPPPPVAGTGPAIAATTSSVTLSGEINPNGATTGWRFEYGLTSSYATYTNGGTVAAGKTPVIITESLAGLEPGTIFHYRLVAFHGSVATGYGLDQIFMTKPSPAAKSSIHVHTSPGHARRRPFTFTTSGSVAGPAFIPAQFACTGSVAIRFFLGRRDVSFILVPLLPNCTFAGQTVFAHLPGRGPKHRTVVLRVTVRYRGNGYLRQVPARSQLVKLS